MPTTIPGNLIFQSPTNNDTLLDLNTQPSLDLQFAASKTLDDRVSGLPLVDHQRDVSSGKSAGTYVGSDGLIKTSVANLLTYSNEFTNAAWDKNEVILTPNAAEAPDGTFTATKISATTVSTDEHRLVHTTSAGSGIQTIWSVYAKAGENTKIGLRRNSSDGLDLGQVDLINGTLLRAVPGYTTTITNAANGWWRISLSFSTTAAAYLRPCICPIPDSLPTTADADTPYSDDGSSGIYIWGAQMEEGTIASTYIPTTNLPSAAPRFDHDPVTGESLGLLVEESRTNLVQRSEEFDDTYWFKRNSAAIVANTVVAPDGNTTADELQHPGGSTYARIETTGATPSVTSGVSYSFTIYAKYKPSSDANYLGIQFQRASGFSYINLSTKTVDSGDGDVELLGNDWIRFRRTFAADSTGTSQVYIYPTNTTDTTPSSIAANAGLYIWGAQLEKGSFPTSYIHHRYRRHPCCRCGKYYGD